MLSALPDFITKKAPTFPDYITIKNSARSKRISLRLNAKSGKFDLTIPKYTSLHEAYKFVQSQKNWIEKHLNDLPEAIKLQHGSIIPILGINKTLIIKENPTSARTKIDVTDNEIVMLTHLQDTEARLEKFFKKLGKEEFTKLAQQKANKIDKTITSITLRDPRSRWGSCSEDGKIMLSWRLIFAPYAAMDYVIAHEVAHLMHMDHSKAFWTQCRELSDDFLEGSHWMQEHGNSLLRYNC